MREIKFSVVIPCYNGVKYIEECLVSLSAQTYKNFEVIFIDDNSSDGSFELAWKLKENLSLCGKFIKKLDKFNKGVSASRNMGVREAEGSWIVFLDCDDYFLNHKLEVLDQYLTDHPEAYAIHHAYEKFDDASGEIRIIQVNPAVKHDLNFLLLDNPIGTSTVAVKKVVLLETGGFNENLQGIEDYYLWCRISNKYGAWSYIPKVLTRYRFLADSLMSRRKLSYYVGQVEGLFREAAASNEFTNDQVASIYYNCFFNQLNYRVDISLKYYGFSDFLNGLWRLSKNGSFKAAVFHLKKRLKNYTLLKASGFLQKIKSEKNKSI